MRLRKKFQKGEIATIIALASMAFILLTTITSTLISKKPQTTSTKAYTSEGTSATSTETKTPTVIPNLTSSGHGCSGIGYSCRYNGDCCNLNCSPVSHICVPVGSTPTVTTNSSLSENTSLIKCCTISNLCGSGGCKVNGVATKYVRKYPNVSSCTGPYVPCPNNVDWHNEIEGCLETSSCTDAASDGSTQGCDITDQTCPSLNGKYNVKKFGTGTTATFTYYPSSSSNCSGNGYKSVDEACSKNINPTATPTLSKGNTVTPGQTQPPASGICKNVGPNCDYGLLCQSPNVCKAQVIGGAKLWCCPVNVEPPPYASTSIVPKASDTPIPTLNKDCRALGGECSSSCDESGEEIIQGATGCSSSDSCCAKNNSSSFKPKSCSTTGASCFYPICPLMVTDRDDVIWDVAPGDSCFQNFGSIFGWAVGVCCKTVPIQSHQCSSTDIQSVSETFTDDHQKGFMIILPNSNNQIGFLPL